MRADAILFLILTLCLLTGAVGAADLSAMSDSSRLWVVANGADTSVFTVTVQNTTGLVKGATVTFTVDNPVLGTMSPVTVTTNPSGVATSTFRVNKTSGQAIVTATISYSDAGTPVTVPLSKFQNIDHDTPYYDASLSPQLLFYPAQGNTTEEVPFGIHLYDRWGNPVDNRTGNHIIGLYVSSPLSPDDCGFRNGTEYSHAIQLPLLADGTLTVPVRLTSKVGTNYIQMSPVGDISLKTVAIDVVSGGTPVLLEGTISNGGILPANNIDKFVIDYFLYDSNGNPMANRTIWISTNLTDEQTPTAHTSDTTGLIRFYYGPKMSMLAANISAYAAENTSITKYLIAQFVAAEAENVVLTVSPQIMPSEDVSPGYQAFVRATVVDQFGNPVPGEAVSFSLGTPSGNTLVTAPALSAATATTDANGNAIVMLTPGGFPAFGQPGYSSAATGSVDVTATWNSVARTVTATWKNYPYVNIETSVEPPAVRINETFDVTIEVSGNGYTMGGGGVTAMLDFDSSSSMWSNKDTPPAGWVCADPSQCKRMDSAKAAGYAFVESLLTPPTNNWVGLDSFGYNKKVNPPLQCPQQSLTVAQDKIDALLQGTTAQGMESSIVDSINNITSTQGERPTDKVRAVVVLKDTAKGGSDDGETAIALAQSTTPPTMVFTVYYNDGNGVASEQELLMKISNRTGGQFFMATDSDELVQAFRDIAQILKTMAGVNVTMNLNFQHVQVNSTSEEGWEAFSYVANGTPYAMHADGLTRDLVLGRTRIMWPNASNSVWDQTTEWVTNQSLKFNIGTINVTDEWNATYRLRATNFTGLINLFNCSLSQSSLTFDDGSATQDICPPSLFITVNPNTTPLGLQSGALDVADLTPQSGEFTDTVPMHWTLNYTGFDTVTETYAYSYNGLPYRTFGSQSGIPSTNGAVIARSWELDIRRFPAGEYRIRVLASVPGIPSDSVTGAFTIPGRVGEVNIELR